MKICHNQPHLVPPMRLVVYDDIPPSPTPKSTSHISQFMSRGRSLASRASDRASLHARKRSSSRPTISAPTSFRRVDPPRRRLEAFRPLELSIYQEGNRLSDLPEFDAAEFNAIGEIRLPPKALIRARSEDIMARSPSFTLPRKPAASMVDSRALGYWQPSSPQLPSDQERPQSPDERNLLWNSLPGLPVESGLSPVSENMSTPWPKLAPHAPTNDTVLTFPIPSDESTPRNGSFYDRALSQTPPSRFAHPEPLRSHSIVVDDFSVPPSTPPNRVTQWLSNHSPSPSASTSIPNTPPTYNNLAATKRFQIYNPPSTPPRTSHSHTHIRTRTASISTVSSTTLFSRADSLSSLTSMTTTPTLKSSRTRPVIHQRMDSLPPANQSGPEEDAPALPERSALREPFVTPRQSLEQPRVGVAF